MNNLFIETMLSNKNKISNKDKYLNKLNLIVI